MEKEKGVTKTDINKYIELVAKAPVVGEPIEGVAEQSKQRCPSTVINSIRGTLGVIDSNYKIISILNYYLVAIKEIYNRLTTRIY